MGARASPGRRKKFAAKFTGQVVSAPPDRARVQFLGNRGDLDGGNGQFSSFSLCFEGRLKGRQLFEGRKVHPAEKILATPMGHDFDL